MKRHPVRLSSSGAGIACLALSLFAAQSSFGAVVWNGASGVDTNWSTPGNWVGGVAPVSTDDVKFFDSGPVVTVSNVDNIVDPAFTGTIASLQYGMTNNTHTTLITNGVLLNVTGGNGLTVGTFADNGNAQIVNATITGAGALNVSNPAANIVIDQGRSANGNGTQRAILDMSGLSMFSANIGTIAVGTTTLGGANNAQNATGTLKLAQTNAITATMPGSAITANVSTPTNSIQIGSDNGNAGGVDLFFLGQSNQFFIDSIGVGTLKATASMLFNTGLNNPVAYFRGTNGANSRVRFWSVGDMSSSGNSSANCNGTNDFSGGTADIMIDTLSLGRDRQGGNTGTTVTKGTFTFTAGTVDVNNAYVGNQQFSATANSNPMAGVMNVSGPTAVLKVNTNLYLGRTSVSSVAASNTSGILNVTNGTLYINNLIVGTNAVGGGSTTNKINLFNATMVVTNTFATNGAGLSLLNISNATIGLTIPANGTLRGVVQTLNSIGNTNLILLDSKPVIFPIYPTNISLIHYTNWTGSNVFGLAGVPDWAPGATIFSNGPNQTIDISLPTDPRPVIAGQPSSYSGNPGDNVTTNFAIVINNGSGESLTYSWYYFATGGMVTNLLADGPGPSGTSVIANSETPNMTLSGAQPGDNGNYFVVVGNIYGSVTSSVAVLNISAGCSSPQVTGPAPQTVVQGNNATFTASVTGNPLPYQQWQRNGVDIDGANSSTLVVNNVQYPADDQAVFSLIVTNDCGAVTNSALLTVIVPPVITNQPASLTVTNGNSATFTVVAGGIPAPTYQWYKNNLANPISGATGPSFTIATTAPTDTANYFVVVANAADSVTSSNVSLTVDSSMGTVSTSPANNAAGICYDTPLTIVFSQAPTLNNQGTIKIYNVTNPATPVDTLNLSQGSPQSRVIGGNAFNSYPVIITGNTAVIYPHLDVLTSNQTYYVTIDPGVFTDSTGAYFAGVSDSTTWQFTTKPAGPADPVNPVVAADGSADFVTVQGALDSLPTSGAARRVIHIQDGNYVEIVNVTKTNVTFRGQSRTGTVVGYANNNNINPSTGTRMAFHVNAFEVAVENMTIHNTTPQGGSQAEALMIDANGSHFILNNAEVDSRQDTILDNSGTSSAYFYNSLIQGNFDYIWGGGVLFATNCEIRTIGGTGTPNLAAPRTVNGSSGNWQGYSGLLVSNGFSFVQCQLTRAAGVTNCSMSDHNGQPNGLAAWINCSIDLNCYTNADATARTSQLLWEYGCSNADNTILLDNTASPFLDFTQLNNGDPRLLAAENAVTWLNGWAPQLAPNILTNPANQSIAGGQSASFTVGATCVGDPTYQWQKNGTNIDGATNAMFTVNNASVNDAASYSVIVSNAAGVVASSAAVLTVGNSAPELRPIPTQIISVGVPFSITNIATDPDEPIQSLTFSQLAGPGTLDPGTGILSWRPPVASAGSSNYVTVVVTDTGSPNLSATNNFAILVNPVAAPSSSVATFANGQFSMTINGDFGPDYVVQVSTDMVSWQSIFTNNAPTPPFTFTDTNSVNSLQFYRVLLAP